MASVLMVEDNLDALALRKIIFECHGHQVVVASSAAQAREQFQTAPPDSVILDLRLPRLEDGLALIRDFRAASQQLKIVVLAGRTADLDGHAEAALVDLVLAKPSRSEVLLAAIRV